MSYNITSWKTKRLENLVVPLKAFYESENTNWHPSQPEIINADGDVELRCGCEQTIKGKLRDGMLTITEFDMTGEGSARFKSFILDDVLLQSTGQLEVIIVWEGGDSISSLKVNDGVLEETDIEL
jgi:hypothetical protein